MFKKYNILGHWASGETSNVYLAEYHGSPQDELHALKLLHPEFTHKLGGWNRFRKQAHSALTWQHPNLVILKSVFQEDGRLYVGTEFVHGVTLNDFDSASAAALPAPLIVAIACATAKALLYVSQQTEGEEKQQNEPGPQISGDSVYLSFEGEIKVANLGFTGSRPHDLTPKTQIGLLLWQLLTGSRTLWDAQDPRSELFSALKAKPIRTDARLAQLMARLSEDQELTLPELVATLQGYLDTAAPRYDTQGAIRELLSRVFPAKKGLLEGMLSRWRTADLPLRNPSLSASEEEVFQLIEQTLEATPTPGLNTKTFERIPVIPIVPPDQPLAGPEPLTDLLFEPTEAATLNFQTTEFSQDLGLEAPQKSRNILHMLGVLTLVLALILISKELLQGVGGSERTVTAASVPPGVNVLLNHKLIGSTPVTMSVPSDVAVELSFEKEGYHPVLLSAPPGAEAVHLRATLTPVTKNPH